MIKLFLDDVRNPPDDTWVVVRSYDEFVNYIEKEGVPDFISFDHDLGLKGISLEPCPNCGGTNWDDSLMLCRDCLKVRHLAERAVKGLTGFDCAKYLVDNDLLPPQGWASHSHNPEGRKNILNLLYVYREFKDNLLS